MLLCVFCGDILVYVVGVYLYFGNPELRYVLLNEDMISYDETAGIVRVPMTVGSFGKGGHMTGTTYGEGPWFYKRNGLYYMVFAAFAAGEKHNEHFGYAILKVIRISFIIRTSFPGEVCSIEVSVSPSSPTMKTAL